MERLSYSAHLSQKNSAINSKAKLAGVAKHNLRKYRSNDYDKENIVILWGTDKLVQDVKKVYMIILKRPQSQTRTWQWN